MNDVWGAMSDPTRRKILAMLRKGNMTAGEIADNFDMTKPSISHHLNILKQAELVDAEKKGQQIEYSINTTVLQDILSYVVGLTDKEENE
ncbi:ArsR family transcriptional regulator [Hydrogenoanaerobacterium saccharovorans]|uniref:Transcriptional regulator, ArsR family n=1 Tax=Hydrogenoanaerobacterium saccharovorans TaxID=474960 RepID=A0A1H8A0F5_9FIRM|nr:autorepressor SdpR family transcription factor [Hydrogenoanaerobacterium saccharovorans]RPF48293.1 ArsR family transcriptional regulator [Hydrogenoanaerobacterium saccharovorans]SEM63394.1 transcriptional regulator, ArsR family [Hydrogenoanaerobacterium saccharovorans]